MKKILTNILKHIYLKESEIHCLPIIEPLEWEIINLYPDISYQTWYGFGGSFTEATCHNMHQLSPNKYHKLLQDYYGVDGLQYSLGRLPIGSCDFSLQSYSYTLKHDKEWIIPTVLDSLQVNNDILWVASPWSPPKEWKQNQSLINGGSLLKKHYQDYANYLIQFIKDYQKQNININYITIQNEPMACQRWESCLWQPQEESVFINKYLGPELIKAQLNTYILLWDHNKDCLYRRIEKTITSTLSSRVKGVAYHWYTGTHLENLSLIHEKYPHFLLFHTESCCGFSPYRELEWVKDAELIGLDIIGDMNHFMNAHIDWNMVLNYNGGPTWANNFCKAPIILTEDEKDYIKTPIYYYLAHFAKYIKAGYQRIAVSVYMPNIFLVAFKSKESVVVVVLNNKDTTEHYHFCMYDQYFEDFLEPHSIVTYLIDL